MKKKLTFLITFLALSSFLTPGLINGAVDRVKGAKTNRVIENGAKTGKDAGFSSSRMSDKRQTLDDWMGIIFLYTDDEEYSTLDNRFGVSIYANDEYDGMDASWMEPQPGAIYGALYFLTPEGHELIYDIRGPDFVEKTWHFRVVNHNMSGNWILRWPNLYAIPGAIHLVLEASQDSVIIPDLQENPFYNFSMISDEERDFYLHVTVTADTIQPFTNVGFVQNPDVSDSLDLYIYPSEPLDEIILFVDEMILPVIMVDPLYNVYRATFRIAEQGEKEIVLHTIDLNINIGIDSLYFNFSLVEGSVDVVIYAPDSLGLFSIPGGFLPDSIWIGMSSRQPPATSGPEFIGNIYNIQPLDISFPEGTELILSGLDIDNENLTVRIYRESEMGWIEMPTTYEIADNTFHTPINQGGHYVLMRTTELSSEDDFIPAKTLLLDNYPNPFNTSTVVRYFIPASSNVSVKVYDLLGREVIELVNSYQDAGAYRILWNGQDKQGKFVSSNVYFLMVKTEHNMMTKKLLLLK